MAAVEVQTAPVRLALRLAPKSFGANVPRNRLIEPHGDGLRLFVADGVTAVIIETAGHASQRVAIPTQALAKVLDRHNDAEILAVAPTPDGADFAWRVRSFSDTFTAVAEMPRWELLDASGVARVLEVAEPQERNEGGTWQVMALSSLTMLLTAKEWQLDRLNIATVGAVGPLVVTFAGEGFTGTLLIMRCAEKAK